MLDCQNDLRQNQFRSVLLQVNFFLQHFTQIPTRHKLHHEHMNATLRETVWCLHQMLACHLLENLVFVSDLLELFMSPILANINHLQRVKITRKFLPCSVYLAECPLSQKLENLKILQTNSLCWFASALRMCLWYSVLIFIVVIFFLWVRVLKHHHRLGFTWLSIDFLWPHIQILSLTFVILFPIKMDILRISKGLFAFDLCFTKVFILAFKIVVSLTLTIKSLKFEKLLIVDSRNTFFRALSTVFRRFW